MKISGSSYKMTYQSKRLLSRILDPHYRGEVKRLLIQAEITSANKTVRSMPKDTGDSSAG
jgi:hypothetical protein